MLQLSANCFSGCSNLFIKACLSQCNLNQAPKLWLGLRLITQVTISFRAKVWVLDRARHGSDLVLVWPSYNTQFLTNCLARNNLTQMFDNSKYKVGKNLCANRLKIMNGKIKIDWLCCVFWLVFWCCLYLKAGWIRFLWNYDILLFFPNMNLTMCCCEFNNRKKRLSVIHKG